MSFNILYISIDLFESDSEVFKYKDIHIDLYLQTDRDIHAHTTDTLHTLTLTSVTLKVRPALRGKLVPELRDWKGMCWTWGLLTGPNCPPGFPSTPWLARFIWEPCKEL